MTSSKAEAGLSKYLSDHASFQNPRSSASPLPALYSDLSRQRKSNPAGYRASVEWWKDILLDVTFQGLQFDRDAPPSTSSTSADPDGTKRNKAVDRTVFRLDEGAKARWTVEGVGRPLGLGTVVADLEKDRTLVPLSTYLKSTSPIAGPSTTSGLRSYIPTPRGVASALLLTPARWAASSLYSLALGGSSGNDDDDYSEDERLFRAKRGEWVWFELVSRLSESFLADFYATEANLSPLSLLMTTSEFNAKLASHCEAQYGWPPSDRDASLVLRYLERDRPEGPAVYVQDGLIKFAPTPHTTVEDITEEDRGIIAVHSTLLKLDLQIASLSTQISTLNESIKTSLRANQSSQAKSQLRRRKALEAVLEKRLSVRETLDSVMTKIEQAKGDVEVMRAFHASEGVLRKVLSSDELKIENVEKTMEGLDELVARQGEVDAVIREGGKVGMGEVDADDVEDELRALENEKRREDEAEAASRRLEESKAKEKAAQESKQADDKKLEDDLKARFDRLRVAQSPPATSPPAEKASQSETDPTAPSKEAIAE